VSQTGVSFSHTGEKAQALVHGSLVHGCSGIWRRLLEAPGSGIVLGNGGGAVRTALFAGQQSDLIMNNSEDSYRRICDQVWALYQAQLEKEKLRRSKRKVFLPRRRGGGARTCCTWAFHRARSRESAMRPNARRPSAWPANSNTSRPPAAGARHLPTTSSTTRSCNSPAALTRGLASGRRLTAGKKELFVEFTDALHIATDHRIADDLLAVMNPEAESCPVCLKCKEILEAELALYQPRVVICSGRLPSRFVWDICTGRTLERPVKETMLKETRFGCKVHFSVT